MKTAARNIGLGDLRNATMDALSLKTLPRSDETSRKHTHTHTHLKEAHKYTLLYHEDADEDEMKLSVNMGHTSRFHSARAEHNTNSAKLSVRCKELQWNRSHKCEMEGSVLAHANRETCACFPATTRDPKARSSHCEHCE